jgi:hypothetical protein
VARLAAITTCKGRLEHLKQTLPALMAEPELEVVVVDYDCPDRAGDWVRNTHPRAKVVAVLNRPYFNRSEAKNLGAAAASADWLFFADADVRVDSGFASSLEGLQQPGVFLLPKPMPSELWGALIVSRADFDAVGGYDEAMEGWGSEDVDIIERLMIARVREDAYPGEWLHAIPHGDALRFGFHDPAAVGMSAAINGFYRTAKNDLIRQGVILDLEARRKLYADVRRACAAPGGIRSFQIEFRRTDVPGLTVRAALRYDLAARNDG